MACFVMLYFRETQLRSFASRLCGSAVKLGYGLVPTEPGFSSSVMAGRASGQNCSYASVKVLPISVAMSKPSSNGLVVWSEIVVLRPKNGSWSCRSGVVLWNTVFLRSSS